jgi:preprotein translocase subunit SecA
MRIFGSEKISAVVDRLGLDESEAIESKMVSKSIESAQKKVEGNNFDIRKTLLQYDDVMNQQREIMYKQRTEVLEGEDMKDQIQTMISDLINTVVDAHLSGLEENIEEDLEHLIEYLEDIFLPKDAVSVEEFKMMSNDEIKDKLLNIATELYSKKESGFGSEQLREIERVILLRVVDTKWMDHIDNMDHLKRGMGLRAYRQQDPVQAYQFEGSDMFEEMINNIKVETIKYLYHVEVQRAPERERVVRETATNYEAEKETARRAHEKVGRNDLCPCGSGKKYKNCHGKDL